MKNHKINQSVALFALLLLSLLSGCYQPYPSPAAHPTETDCGCKAPLIKPTTGSEESQVDLEVQTVQLAGVLKDRQASLTGMAWYSDTLILLPQNPERYKGQGDDGALFTLDKVQLLAYLDGNDTQPLSPRRIALHAPALEKDIPNFQGFQAVAIKGQQIFLLVQGKSSQTQSYLIAGELSPNLSELRLDSSHRAEIPAQEDIDQVSEKALMAAGSRLLTFFEVNGAQENPNPQAHLFTLDLQSQGTLPFPPLEYRLTDVTPPDPAGRFWALNIRTKNDSTLKATHDPLTEEPGGLESVIQQRLVEFQFTEAGIIITKQAPFLILPVDGSEPDNWQALARLDDRGFLVATSQPQEFIFGFISLP